MTAETPFSVSFGLAVTNEEDVRNKGHFVRTELCT